MTDVVMPQMGESITEGTLTKWLKRKGDSVERDEPLFEISTDKVDTEIPAPVAGKLAETLVEEGATVEINTVVARIEPSDGGGAAESSDEEEKEEKAEEPKEEAKPRKEAEPEKKPEAEKKSEPAPKKEEPKQEAEKSESQAPLSPLVRRMAREHNIDLSRVEGTGAGGRITKRDVESYLDSGGAEESAPVPSAAPAKAHVEPMSNMRQKIAEHMIFSKQTSAHVTTVHRVDMTKIARMRSSLKHSFKERYGFSLTYLPFITRATAQALREFPVVNASIDGKNILYHNGIHIGIAVALDDGKGLIVPVIRNADSFSIVGLQRAIVDLAQRARSRQLKPDEVQGGTFSITNFGSYGSLFATPVINQPNVAILGVGAVTKEPIVTEDDAIAIRSTAYLTLTFDHRLIDGALADLFCLKVKQVLEGWSEQVL